MEKSFLEKRLEERAEKRLDDEIRKLNEFISENPITCKMTITFGEGKLSFACASGGAHFSFINGDMDNEYLRASTNISEIKAELFHQYLKEETDKVLKKITDVEYLFR